MSRSKRLLAFILSVLLLCGNTLIAFADNLGNSYVPTTPPPIIGGSGGNPTFATYKNWGFRITMAPADPIFEENVPQLGDTYTSDDLQNNYNAIADITKTRYWTPGGWGLNFYTSDVYTSGPNINFVYDSSEGRYFPRPGIRTGYDAKSQNVINPLAWYIWDTIPGQTRTYSDLPYSADLHGMALDASAAGADPGKWLADMHAVYNSLPSGNGHIKDPKALLTALVGAGGTNIVQNFASFTWATHSPDSGGTEDPYMKVKWSKLGHLALCIQLCWAAQEAGDNFSYSTFANTTANWVSSGFKAELMPIIMVEATHDYSIGNDTQGPDYFATLPATIAQAYKGKGFAERLFQKWPDTAYDNTQQALVEIVGDSAPDDAGRGALMQGIGGYPAGNAWHNATGSYVPYRNYLKTIGPQANPMTNFGYFINWTYPSDGMPGDDPNRTPDNHNTMGSFKWKLTPDGVHDKTPEKEVNESSTIYELNISQNKHNADNYDRWISAVRGDGIDCNKLRIRIYHISENLAEEQPATKYARDSVKQKGAEVTTPINKVTVNPTGNITGFPAGTITELHNNTWSQNLTDDQFLKIMKEATGLTYSETVAGRLVNGSTPEGVRVTYAVYVDYDIGCKDTGEKYQLSNDQAEWVEYRSIPGTYTFESDSPDGYAEIKCGYFNRDEGYYENYEAMAGSPTTEDLYFASGGQDFVAQIKYEYIGPTEQDQNPEVKNAIRNYEQGYSATQCGGYWQPVTKTFNNATTEEVQAWLNTWTGSPHTSGEFITAHVCPECGTVHQNGTGQEAIHSTSIENSESGDKVSPGGYYSEINLHATHWDWTGCPYESHTEGEPPHEVVDCPGHDAKSDSPSGCCSHDSAVRATRWSGTVTSYHSTYNENDRHDQNQANIKFTQTFKDIRYAKIKDVHVWRLERSRMEGIRQLTFEDPDYIFGEADSYADAVFNVAEDDTALEGRMYYMLHPEDGDNFKFKATLPTRGCCHCFVHNSAEDLIKTNENMVANDQTPATQLEEGWVISDYLVLKGTRATASLLYAQYQSRNKDANKYPILNIRVSGTDQTSRQDNAYEYLGPDNQWHKITYDTRGEIFETQIIDYNAPITTGQGGSANANDGNEEKICANPETFKGGHVDSDDISWGGYNGDYSDTDADKHGEYSSGELDEVGKYQGIRRVDNWKGDTNKKVFAVGYQHNTQGEVENSGFNTRAPQSWNNPEDPFILVSKPIDVHDIKVHNGEKEFTNSTIFYNNIISYSSAGGPDSGMPLWSEEEDPVYEQRGFHVDTNYSDDYSGINNIIIHNPVSAQYAELVALPSDLDQRIDDDLIIDSLNQDNGKCPGKSNACAYAELHCNYNGTWYHTEECYAKVRGNGLATVPVTGDIHTEMKPVQHSTKNTGTKQYGYTGARQTFTAPVTGRYSIEVWGAQGGTSRRGGSGGRGGYTKGDVYLRQGETIYMYVGEMGSSQGNQLGGYNGGNFGGPQGGGGGGMSSISLSANSKAAPSNNNQSTGVEKRYYFTHETTWLCTDGQWRVVVIDPSNTTDFTLNSAHDYYIAYPNRSYAAKGWYYLYDNTTGYCLSTRRYNESIYGQHYTLNKYANPINGRGDSGLPNTGWNQNDSWLLIAGGGGGAGPAEGGAGGGETGGTGGDRCGSPGAGGGQTRPGAGGSRGGSQGMEGSGGSTFASGRSGGGGGGGGWFGGGAGGVDEPGYHDTDDSGGGGGSGHIDTGSTIDGQKRVINYSTQSGVRTGHGFIQISWNIDTTYTTYEPTITGSLTYDKNAAEVIPTEFKPHIFTASMDGYYSFHLYGSAGGGAGKPGTDQPSRGGKGGYAAGQILLTKGQQVLVTCGGQGSNADSVGASRSGGYNGGGNANTGNVGGWGGGGATDVATNFVYKAGGLLNTTQTGGSIQGNRLSLPSANALYWGPRMTTYKDHIYRVDYYGQNLDKASFAAHGYVNGKQSLNNATLLHSYISSEHVQLFYRVNTQPDANTQEFHVAGHKDGVYISEVFVVDMNDRVLVAGGGGGADNAGGTTGGADDGTGGDGGGEAGTPGLSDGKPTNNAANATSGWLPGIGQDATGTSSGYTDMGAGGAGWYGGYMGKGNNAGGGGGSGKIGNVSNGKLLPGQNSGSGYAVVVYPGKGETDSTLQLSCKEPHHAPNSNYHLFTKGWKHEGGYSCEGVGCPFCANGTTLYTPTGFAITQDNVDELYIIKHDGQTHLTHGPQDDPQNDACDTCGAYCILDTYTVDNETKHKCSWPVTSYDAACYETRGSKNSEHHYSFGDDTCYDPCMNDNNHKKHPVKPNDNPDKAESGKFVILDYDFQIYFPNLGDFYGNGNLGIGNTQKPEGFGYYGGKDGEDPMDTTIWLKEKYVVFPFDVTYKGKTYLAGEKVMLGTYDEATYTWHDDAPAGGADAYKYTFHCLLNNLEAAATKIRYVAVAKNTPVDPVESKLEDHNYTRYGSTKRAYHDAFKDYFIDVVGRIGVLSILDTGDFRFSNYYKEAIEGWKVDQVVHEVDLSKQNFVSIDDTTIFGDPVTEATRGQNTWGLTDWMEPISKLRPFPLTPGENNVKALKNQAHRIGYSDYMSLVTVGNYYGENDYVSNNMYKVQIQPFYYYYNLETKQWTPMDVYIRQDGDSYKMINDYGTDQSTTEYNFYYDLNWQAEAKRRMYTQKEENASQAVQDVYYYCTAADDAHLEQPGSRSKIQLPHGIKYLHGTANMLFLRDRNRTFIGTRNRYGANTETDNRIPEVEFNRQAQRWHFTLGLPSTATFVRQGEACTPENIAKYDMDKGVIVVALDIKSKGTVWTLGYDGTPVGERSFYLFDNNTTKISWEDAGANGPEDKTVVLVYTNSKTSRNDLSTEGTH